MNVDQLDKACQYLKSGGDMNAIKSKYKLTKVQEKELTRFKNGQKTENTKETK